jgi:multidrug efflux pump subunit AcrA (membrane-fusion protein)
MDSREVFIEQAMRGEKLGVESIARNQAERELDSIETEAARRLDEGRRQREAAGRREQQINDLLTLAAEATAICADSVENERRKNEVIRQFAVTEIELRDKYYRVYSQFSQIFHELSGEAYDWRLVNNSILKELRERGAVLDKVDFQLTRLPLSPMAQMLSDGR